MNSIKLQIDSQFDDYAYTRGIDEIFTRYKKRNKSIKKASTTISVVCIVVIIALFSGNMANLLGFGGSNKNGLGIVAYALDNTDSKTTVSEKKKLVKDSNGVQKKQEKVIYDSEGYEIIADRITCTVGDTVEKRTVIVPSPIKFKISLKNVEECKIESSYNGSLYDEDYDYKNMICVAMAKGPYDGNREFYWIPNCEKITSDLHADILRVPSTLENDRLATKEINSLLKTSDDYTKYFGGTVKITVYYADKTTETIKIKITLDKNGRYYVSTVK